MATFDDFAIKKIQEKVHNPETDFFFENFEFEKSVRERNQSKVSSGDSLNPNKMEFNTLTSTV